MRRSCSYEESDEYGHYSHPPYQYDQYQQHPELLPPYDLMLPPSPMFERSNRGASKQRRDQINSEIGTMRDLLPLAESARQRLSQLQIMSLSCVYIRKCNILQKLFRSSRQGKDLPCDFFQALTGFMLVTTREGKLLYISENVTDYLGHSMVDMKTQGDCLYDIVDKRDHSAVQTQLQSSDINQDISFYCRMNMSRSLKRQAGFGDVKIMHVRGHFKKVPVHETTSDIQYVFTATCTPLITPELKENMAQNNTMIFKTVHNLDMTFLEITETAEHHLGYTNEEISRKSWYNMLHPEDIHVAREKHVQLIRSSHEMGCMAILRMIRADGSVLWINMVMHVRQAAVASNDEPVIVCINQVVSEQEAYQFKLQSNSFSIYPLRTGDLWTHGAGNIQNQPQTTQWMPNTSNFGQFSTLRNSPPGFLEQMNQSNYMNHRRGRPAQPPTTTSIHTEKVKQMLQKKITSQCKPAKIPRIDRTEKPETFHGEFGLGVSSNFFFGSFEPFNDASLSFEPFGQSNTQVMPVSNYAVSRSPSLTKKNVMVEPQMMNQSSCLSPNLQMEQVVPDQCLQIPESFLTPEASPASSPEHKSSSDGNSSLDNSFDILEDLSKLQQFRAIQKSEKVEKAGMKRKRKGLPFIDALDIESFFDELTPVEKKMTPSKPVIKLEKKPSLPDLDSDDLEEFLNWIDVKPCSPVPPPAMCIKQEPLEVPIMAANSCFRSQYTSTQSMQSQSPHHSVPSPVSTISEVFSPGPCYSSELSEEELLDELNSSPMTLTVDVGTMRDEFEALQQAHFPGDPMPVESELTHLHRLLKELVPSSGSRGLLKDSQ